MARRMLALCLTLIGSVVGFAYLSRPVSLLIRPGVNVENPLTNTEAGISCFLVWSLIILLCGFLGTLIAGPRGYKVSAGLVVGICTFMAIVVGAVVIGIDAKSTGMRAGITIMAAVGFIAVGALSYLTVCFALGRVYNRR
jgi:hypothetical protein